MFVSKYFPAASARVKWIMVVRYEKGDLLLAPVKWYNTCRKRDHNMYLNLLYCEVVSASTCIQKNMVKILLAIFFIVFFCQQDASGLIIIFLSCCRELFHFYYFCLSVYERKIMMIPGSPRHLNTGVQIRDVKRILAEKFIRLLKKNFNEYFLVENLSELRIKISMQWRFTTCKTLLNH